MDRKKWGFDMKNIRKLMSLLLALIMSLSLAIPCFAFSSADDDSSLMWAWGFDSNGVAGHAKRYFSLSRKSGVKPLKP